MNDKDAKDTAVQNKNINYLQQKLYRTYILTVCLFYGVYRHFQQYFSYIVAISFIDGENWRI
jgi:hypothetical protein